MRYLITFLAGAVGGVFGLVVLVRWLGAWRTSRLAWRLYRWWH